MLDRALDEARMTDAPTPEQKKLLADVPKGTLALTLTVATLMFAAWVAMYVGRFMMQGPVS